MHEASDAIPWRGVVASVQPRISLHRSFDEMAHSYHGYTLRIERDDDEPLLVGIGKAAQAKHEFAVGDEVSGRSYPVRDPEISVENVYKTSKLEVLHRAERSTAGPPWHLVAPGLPTYRERGHRRVAPKTYENKCSSCIWGCKAAVDIMVDHWKPHLPLRHRFETFCYGPLSCRLHRAGPARKVPGRRGMSWLHDDHIDELLTGHRAEHE